MQTASFGTPFCLLPRASGGNDAKADAIGILEGREAVGAAVDELARGRQIVLLQRLADARFMVLEELGQNLAGDGGVVGEFR